MIAFGVTFVRLSCCRMPPSIGRGTLFPSSWKTRYPRAGFFCCYGFDGDNNTGGRCDGATGNGY